MISENVKIWLAICLTLEYIPRASIFGAATGRVSEWSNEHDWKSCVRQKRTEGSNPSPSARKPIVHPYEQSAFFVAGQALRKSPAP